MVSRLGKPKKREEEALKDLMLRKNFIINSGLCFKKRIKEAQK